MTEVFFYGAPAAPTGAINQTGAMYHTQSGALRRGLKQRRRASLRPPNMQKSMISVAYFPDLVRNNNAMNIPARPYHQPQPSAPRPQAPNLAKELFDELNFEWLTHKRKFKCDPDHVIELQCFDGCGFFRVESLSYTTTGFICAQYTDETGAFQSYTKRAEQASFRFSIRRLPNQLRRQIGFHGNVD